MPSLPELRDRRNWFRRATLSLLLPPRKRPRRCWPAASVSISSKRQRREPPPPPPPPPLPLLRIKAATPEERMLVRNGDYCKFMETTIMRDYGLQYYPPSIPSFHATMKPFLEEYNDSDTDSGSDSDESDYGYNNKNKNYNNHNNSFNIGGGHGRGRGDGDGDGDCDGDRGEITTSNNTNNVSTITSYCNGEDANHDPGSGSDPESWRDIFADEDSSGNFVYYDPRGEEVVQNVTITTTPMARRGGGLPLAAPPAAANPSITMTTTTTMGTTEAEEKGVLHANFDGDYNCEDNEDNGFDFPMVDNDTEESIPAGTNTNTTTTMLPQPSTIPVPPPLAILPTTTTTQLPDVDTSKENVSDNAQHETPAPEPSSSSRRRRRSSSSSSTDRRRRITTSSRQSFVAARERKRKAQNPLSEEEESEGYTTDKGGSTIRANYSLSARSFPQGVVAASTFRPSNIPPSTVVNTVDLNTINNSTGSTTVFDTDHVTDQDADDDAEADDEVDHDADAKDASVTTDDTNTVAAATAIAAVASTATRKERGPYKKKVSATTTDTTLTRKKKRPYTKRATGNLRGPYKKKGIATDNTRNASVSASASTSTSLTYPEEFYHAIKNDKVGNKILYLDIPLPRKMEMQCHPSIRCHLRRVAPKISDLLISNNLVRHPTSKFSMVLKPMDEYSQPMLYSINKPHQIPLWYNPLVEGQETASATASEASSTTFLTALASDDDNDEQDFQVAATTTTRLRASATVSEASSMAFLKALRSDTDDKEEATAATGIATTTCVATTSRAATATTTIAATTSSEELLHHMLHLRDSATAIMTVIDDEENAKKTAAAVAVAMPPPRTRTETSASEHSVSNSHTARVVGDFHDSDAKYVNYNREKGCMDMIGKNVTVGFTSQKGMVPISSSLTTHRGMIAIEANKRGMIAIEANNTGMIMMEEDIESNTNGTVMMEEDDVEANRDEKPEKIGMTIAGLPTRRELDNNQGDPNRFDRAFIVMDSGLIRAKEDKEIVGILEEFVNAVLADTNVPEQLCLLFKSYRRGGNNLGLRKQWYYQILEISLQYYFGVASPAEAFACDCKELETRLSLVKQVDDMLQVYFSKYQGKQVTVIESWKTGAKAARLSSQWTLAEYFACGAPLRNAAPNPVYPNATTPEEIFSDDYTETKMKQFRNEVMTDIATNQKAKGILFLCHWEKLFSFSELDNFLSRLGYKLTCNVFQDDLIFYVDSNQESMVAVYHPPGIGLDSRVTTTIIQSIRRLQLIEIIRRFVLFIQGKELVDDLKKKGRSLIDTAGFMFESVWKHSHQNKFVAAAIGRDTYTPSSINATTQNGLQQASHTLVAPYVRKQYYTNNHHISENIHIRNIEIKMANLLSFTNRKNINATLNTICHELTNDNPKREVLKNRWDWLKHVIRPNSVLLQLVQEYLGKRVGFGIVDRDSSCPFCASEIDFDVSDPPLEPSTPASKQPICESPADVNSFDVLCGRGTQYQVGNRSFRKLVQEFHPMYLLARRKEKPLLARTIVLIIRKRGGRFLKIDDETGELYEIGDSKAEEKTSHALRDGRHLQLATLVQARTAKAVEQTTPPLRPPYGYPPPPTQHHSSYLPHAFPPYGYPPPPTQHHSSYLPHPFSPYGYPPHGFGYGYSDGYGIPTQYHPPYPPQEPATLI